jgi:hypothetical protein
MCWNASASMNSFLLVLFATFVGIYNHVLSISQSAFFLSYGSMQLVEYFLWTFPSLNKIFSMAGLSLIVSQPLFSILQLNSSNYITPLLVGYLCFLIYSIYIAVNPKKFHISFSSTVAPNGHLMWNWLPTNLLFLSTYLILMFTPLYLTGNTL